MSTQITHASIDERGKIAGGKAGDQTGKEVCTRSYYSKNWNVVVRFKLPEMREKVADCMVKAANNPRIGYDQGQRRTLLDYARNVGYDPSKITTPCECDCSSLVTLACLYAGIREASLVVNGNPATTSTLRKRLQATGAVDVFTSKDFTASDKKLIRGDILINEGHHTAVVTQTSNDPSNKSIEDVAREVLDGKWGTGEERRSRLISAGYDYKAVQAEVNFLLGYRL